MKTTLIPAALLVALFSTVVWWQGGRIDAANEQIGQSSQRIAYLGQANMAQAAQLQALRSRLDDIDNNTKGTTDALKHSLAIPEQN